MPIRVGVRSGRLNADSVVASFDLAGAGVELDGNLHAAHRQDNRELWDVSLAAGNPAKLKLQVGEREIRMGWL